MFDFTIVCSRPEYLTLRKNTTHSAYLNNVDYISDSRNGMNFRSEFYAHTEAKNDGIANEDGLYVFLIGKAYPNNKCQDECGTQDSSITSADILLLYKKHGEGFIRYLKGIFVLVLIDDNKCRSFAYTSRSGLYKLYYCVDGKRLVLATSISSIIQNCLGSVDTDAVGVIQHSLFQHPLGNRTHYNNVKILEGFSYLTYDLDRLEIKNLVDLPHPGNLTRLYTWEETYQQIPQVFNHVLDTITPTDRFNCALTGGFDSRTVLSRLINRPELKYRLYSWAADERWHDVEVAKSIAEKFGLDYKAILLNNDMLDKYSYYASQHVYWTDGLGSINRTNQMYSHWILSQYSRDIMTGYFGSELFRPLARHNIMISEAFVETYLDTDRKSAIQRAITELVDKSPLDKNFIDQNREATIEETYRYFQDMDITQVKGHNLLLYLIKTGFWKFYGQEFHAQRIHNRINSPYMDDDFIDFLLKTPVWEMHARTHQFDPRAMLKGQAFYLPILKANSIPLMNHATNRGFSPADFESWLYPLNVVVKHQFHKRKLLKRNIMGFNSRAWNKIVYQTDKDVISKQDGIFKELGDESLKSGFWYSMKWYLQTNHQEHRTD